jgi:hypothetical protein
MLILHKHTRCFPPDISPSEIQKMIEAYRAWAGKTAAAGRLKGGHKLRDNGGKHLSLDQDKMRVIDGPYAEVKEVVGGYFIIEAESEKQAIELTRDHPHLKYGAKIELREVEPT